MIKNIRIGDFIEMKKKHPCGEKKFEVLYAASDVKIRCTGCNREMILPRVKLEKNIKRVISGDQND